MPLLTGTFINWTPEMTNSMIGYMVDLFNDLSNLLVPVIAIGVGLIVIGAIIRAIRG